MRVAVDVVVLSLGTHGPVFLSAQRTDAPFDGQSGLPGVLIAEDEDLEEAVARTLASSGGLAAVRHLEQLATFGRPDRDPRGRVVSVSYLGLVPEPTTPNRGGEWRPAVPSPELAFDHGEILAAAVERLRGKLSYSNVAFGLLPDTFTLSDLQAVYETVLGHELDKRNFRKKVLSSAMLTEAAGQRRGPHRPAQLYRFTHRRHTLM